MNSVCGERYELVERERRSCGKPKNARAQATVMDDPATPPPSPKRARARVLVRVLVRVRA